MEPDIVIATKAHFEPIEQIAKNLGIDHSLIDLYGKYKAKLSLKLIQKSKYEQSSLILVTAISPTPFGEGKTTLTIGLIDAISQRNKKVIGALREPSLGPVFGLKGGATGGGYAQVIPMDEINLHFTGDFSAIEKANNLLAALIDNEIYFNEQKLFIDPKKVTFKRVMDINDRGLREIISGMGSSLNGPLRQTGFNITAASEIMALLCLSEDFSDLKRRLRNIYIGSSLDNKPLFVKDLKVEDALALLLKEAIKPNLVQTLENNPVIIHGGPFANIAQGTNSVIATKMAMSLADIVVTEAGFGSDLGAEKFFNIKCQSSGLKPSLVVLVATIRGLKFHGGKSMQSIMDEDKDALKRGFENLKIHVANMKKFGFTPIIAINKFSSDTDAELILLQKLCHEEGLKSAISECFEKGGQGSLQLADLIQESLSDSSSYTPLYDESLSVKDKIQIVAKEIYRASHVEFSSKAIDDLKKIDALGLNHLKVCISKTQYSLSDDPKMIGVALNHKIHIKEIVICSGAGFVVPITGSQVLMPGLPKVPQALKVGVDDDGIVYGLS